jgi:hypothetical protein
VLHQAHVPVFMHLQSCMCNHVPATIYICTCTHVPQELLDILQEDQSSGEAASRGRSTSYPSSRNSSLASRTLELIQDWVSQESWQLLVQRTAHLLSDDQLLHLVHTIGPEVPVMPGGKPVVDSRAGREGRGGSGAERHGQIQRDGTRGRDQHQSSRHIRRQPEQPSEDPVLQVTSASEWKDMRGLIFGGTHVWQTVPQLVLTHALACNRSVEFFFPWL